MNKAVNILHSSDWHLGHHLFEQGRDLEFGEILESFIGLCKREEIDVLLIAGDLYDTQNPSSSAKTLFFNFLSKLQRETNCRHVVVIAGNHDSAAVIEESALLLRHWNLYLVGAVEHGGEGDQDLLEHEVLSLKDDEGKTILHVGAVPFLRSSDLKIALEGESVQSKEERILRGIERHYDEILTELQKRKVSEPAPVVLMGHLFTQGGLTGVSGLKKKDGLLENKEGEGLEDDESERPLYIGGEARVPASFLYSDDLKKPDYVALGHLHLMQKISGLSQIRYSGSILPMNFDEAKNRHFALKVSFGLAEGGDGSFETKVSEIELPSVRALVRVSGSEEEIFQKLADLDLEWAERREKSGDPSKFLVPFVQILCRGTVTTEAFRNRCEEHLQKSGARIVNFKLKAKKDLSSLFEGDLENHALEHWSPSEVFSLRLEQEEGLPEEDKAELEKMFQEILVMLDQRKDG